MHIAGKLACVGMLVIFTGCSSWNPFSKTVPRNPPAALVNFANILAVRPIWSSTIGNAGNYIFSPVLSGDSVFVAAADGSIARINSATGVAIWRIAAGVRLTAGVGSDASNIAVAAEKGVLMTFGADGKFKWKAQMSSEVLSAPAVGQGLVIARSVDNRIVAFDAESGAKRWMVQRSAPALTLRSAPGIVLNESSAYVAMPGGKLLAIALSNGGVRWEATVGEPRGATELERVTDTSGAPVIIGSDICAVTYQGRVSCFNLANGAVRWAKDLSSAVGVAADERFVFAADERGALNAYARDTGQSVWRNDKLENRRLSTPSSFGRAVAVGDLQGYIHFLSREDGSFIGRVATDGSAIVAPPVLAGSNLIFQTQSGTVTAFAAE